MADTCIVCLGDLSTGNDGVAAQSTTVAESPLADDGSPSVNTNTTTLPLESLVNDKTPPELIAHILPCGHDLHNDCLTPWVERANSCPICRATFHEVELKDYVGGNTISSYSVQDRTQVAELDPSMFLEVPDEEEDDQPCQACGEYDNDDVLMYCDGCDKLWHTYCVDLQEVPRGAWYCDNCRAQREYRPQGRRAGALPRRRTRGQQRRHRGQQQVNNESEWNDVWQTVFSRLGMDLDFPHDEDGAPAAAMRRHRQRVEASRQAHRAFLSRVRVAELVGAGSRFRENEEAILHGSNARRPRASPHPYVETPDETEAWNAFELARAPSPGSSSSRKRKQSSRSKSSSPARTREDPSPIRVKRRRVSNTRNSENIAHVTITHHANPQPTRLSPAPPRPVPTEATAPSFLQSLLQEVEDSSSSVGHLPVRRPSPRHAASPPTEHHSPRPSSPAHSPPPSNHSSPRAMSTTPPPIGSGMRPSSPMGLSSSIQPVFPSTEYSPLRTNSPEPTERKPESPPPRTNGSRIPNGLAQPKPRRHAPRPLEQTPTSSHRLRSTEASPTRPTISLMAKSDVQKLVSAALKPHYSEQKISKDEYTTINRDISRMLYEKIGDLERLDVEGKAKWEKVAGEEVQKAVGALRAQG